MIGFAAAELAARFLYREAPVDPGRLRRAQALVRGGEVALHCYPTDPDGDFPIDLRDPAVRERWSRVELRNFRLLDGAPHCVEARYDAEGFREREPTPGAAGRRRVVLLGGDAVAGFGVRQEQLLSRQLERELASAGDWEALSCASPEARGHALGKGLGRCLESAPDAVVLAFSPVEVDRAERLSERALALFDAVAAEAAAPGAPEWRGSRLLGLLERRLAERRRRAALSGLFRDLFAEPNRRGWLRTRRRIREIAGRVEARGSRFLLAIWPSLFELDGDDPFRDAHRQIAGFAASRRIPYLDLRPALAALPARERRVHPLDARPGAAAFEVAARELARALLERRVPSRGGTPEGKK